MHGSIWCVFIFNERKWNYFDSYEKCFCIKRNKLSFLLQSKIREKKWGNNTMPSPPLSLHSFFFTSPVKQKASAIKSLHGTLLNPPSVGPHFPFFLLLTAQTRLCPSHRPVTFLVSGPRPLQPLICLQIFNVQTSLPASCITHHSLTPTPNIAIHTKACPWASHLETRTLCFILLFFGHTPWLVGSWSPDQGLDPGKMLNPRQLDHQGMPENTPDSTPPSSSLGRRPRSSSAPSPPVQRKPTALGLLHPQLHRNCPS